MIHSVLTGDIVNSTRLEEAATQKLVHKLQDILKPHRFEFYRGDSLQAYIPDSFQALPIALRCRTAAMALLPEAAEVPSDVRISIGIGKVAEPVKSLALAKGPAFVLSGRALDELEKTRGRLAITTTDKMANTAFSVLADHINAIYSQLTVKQAEVILELLNGDTQQQVADKLNKSKSTISQHVTAGRWDEIERILKHYRQIIELLSV